MELYQSQIDCYIKPRLITISIPDGLLYYSLNLTNVYTMISIVYGSLVAGLPNNRQTMPFLKW
jgi:hypothetical protein